MFEKLDSIELRFEQIESDLARGDIETGELMRLSKERASIADVVECYRKLKKEQENLTTAREMLNEKDPDLKELAKEELVTAESNIAELEKELQILTLPRDPNDEKNVILEIRAGTGGEEAALFVVDLMRMYSKFGDKRGWKLETMSTTSSQTGGLKEVIMLVKGDAVYRELKFESGVHRVQRVPQTEAQGRIHTSACTVAILPEASEVDDVPIDSKDLDITVCRASGAGGQHVNTTDSAVRIVHIPSGIVVECQDERSQIKNKDKAMKVLRARLLEKHRREQQESISADRKNQVGSGDRSERIRTYNFPQGRMTDHRINLTLYKLDEIIDGHLSLVVEPLASNHQAELMRKELGDG